MENSIYIALSRQTALRREMTLIANNIANVNTTGFRRELAVYSAQTVNPRSSTPMDFVIDHATAVSFEPGSLRQTGNTFDVAISGPGFGFFAVDDGSGTAYTRNGSFQLGDDNQLLTLDGYTLLDVDDRPVVIPPNVTDVAINRDGTIQNGEELLGRIQIAEFDELFRMRKKGESLFVTDEEPRPPRESILLQGSLEASNVVAIKELTRMIEIQRNFESVRKLIDNEGERNRSAVQRLGRVNPS